MYFSKVSSLISSLSLSFSLHFNLFPSGSTPLIERVCMAGTKRKKEIDNDTRQHCVENLDLSRTQSVSLSHTHSETQKHTTLSPSMLRFLFNYKNIMRALLLGCSPHLFKPTVSCQYVHTASFYISQTYLCFTHRCTHLTISCLMTLNLLPLSMSSQRQIIIHRKEKSQVVLSPVSRLYLLCSYQFITFCTDDIRNLVYFTHESESGKVISHK